MVRTTMAVEVKIDGWDVSAVLDVVHAMRAQGYAQGEDFDFAYKPAQYEPINGHFIYDKHVIFTLYSESLATWFSLRYA